MGTCCSKTDTTTTPREVKVKPNPEQPEKTNNAPAPVPVPTQPEALKKDVFIVNHPKSHEIDGHPDQETRNSIDQKKTPNVDVLQGETSNASGGELGKLVGVATVRTSSCSKEEVEAILIQCGRLSRSSSGAKPDTPTRGRRYSGSKRSFDFDIETSAKNEDEEVEVEVEVVRGPRVSTPSRRRSRERDPLQQRSGSKERAGGERRRVSRSPNRRSESPNPSSNGTVPAGCVTNQQNRPGKMVSVPATDKSSGDAVAGLSGGVKKVQVKRNAGEAVVAVGSRTAASPRARSPATANVRVLNENQNPQPLTLSRSNSRKGEHSPFRRNPLGEIDANVVGPEQPGCKKPVGENAKLNHIVSRTRSLRLSRDLDINQETLINPNQNSNPASYASLLLEDIQNFHQKNPPTAAEPPALPLSASVSKACTILEAVADLKSVVNDDLMEPSLHKYVTVRRGGGDADTEEQESSGSNSFASSQQLSWMSSSWEPNSGDSTDCWTSKSRSDAEVERIGEYPRNGIGRGRVGVHGRSAYSLPNNATVG